MSYRSDEAQGAATIATVGVIAAVLKPFGALEELSWYFIGGFIAGPFVWIWVTAYAVPVGLALLRKWWRK